MHRFNNNNVSFGCFVQYEVVFKVQQFSKVGVTFRNYFKKEFGFIVLLYPIALHWMIGMNQAKKTLRNLRKFKKYFQKHLRKYHDFIIHNNFSFY